MKLKTITTPHGEVNISIDGDGNISTAKEFDAEKSWKQFLVSDDPSQYAYGTVFDDFETALNFYCAMLNINTATQYIIELHYPCQKDDIPPIAIFVYDENFKRTRII